MKSLTDKIEVDRPRVLIAEDCPDAQYLLTILLEEQGIEVQVVGNGLDALSMVQKADQQGKPFDVVIVDLRMPELGGLDATRKLRKLGYCRPIVAMTASASLGSRYASIHAGCDAMLAKSTIQKTLLPTIKNYLVPYPEQRRPLK